VTQQTQSEDILTFLEGVSKDTEHADGLKSLNETRQAAMESFLDPKSIEMRAVRRHEKKEYVFEITLSQPLVVSEVSLFCREKRLARDRMKGNEESVKMIWIFPDSLYLYGSQSGVIKHHPITVAVDLRKDHFFATESSGTESVQVLEHNAGTLSFRGNQTMFMRWNVDITDPNSVVDQELRLDQSRSTHAAMEKFRAEFKSY